MFVEIIMMVLVYILKKKIVSSPFVVNKRPKLRGIAIQRHDENKTKSLAGQERYSLVATVVALLLEHLHTLDDHLALLLPGRVPLVTCIPELLSGERAAVSPGLA
jgi:hypothetical protein